MTADPFEPSGDFKLSYNPAQRCRWRTFSGFTGMIFTVPVSTQVSQLGRYKVAGNNKTHTLRLSRLTGSVGTTVAQVNVDTTGAASNGYVYATLGARR